MRVFVAGASGAVGTRLVRRLVDRGDDVIGTATSPRRAERVRALGAEPVVLDLLDRAAVRRAVLEAAPDAIVHEAHIAKPILAKSLTLRGCEVTTTGSLASDAVVLRDGGDADIRGSIIETTGTNQSGARRIEIGSSSKVEIDDTTVRNGGYGGAVYAAAGADVAIRDSEIRGVSKSIEFLGNSQGHIAHTQVKGDVFGSALFCIGLYDQNDEPVVCS